MADKNKQMARAIQASVAERTGVEPPYQACLNLLRAELTKADRSDPDWNVKAVERAAAFLSQRPGRVG